MVFRQPTHLESFLPPPSQQVPQSKPWRGTLIANVRSIEKTINQELRVTAVETNGDNRVDLWPSHLYLYPTYERSILSEVQTWVARHSPPLCTFMPDRLRDPNETTVNQNNFRSFSRLLFENRMVAIAPWNAPDRLPGGGVIFYPAQNSTALLIGVVFLSSPFPDFVASSLPNRTSQLSSTMSPQAYPQHSGLGASAAYGAVLPRGSSSNSHPHADASSSYRIPQPGASGPATAEMYTMPRAIHHQHYATQASSSSTTDARWTVAKGENENDFAGSNHNQGSRYLM